MIPRGTQVVQYLESFGFEDQFNRYLVSSESFSVDAALDQLTVATEYITGDIVRVSSDDTLPAPLLADTDYYVIKISDTVIKLAASVENALLETAINITDVGIGTHTIKLLSFKLIDDFINNTVDDYISRVTRCSFTGEQEVTEFYSGNGKSLLILNRRNVTEVVEIVRVTVPDYPSSVDVTSVELIGSEGILKARDSFHDSSTSSRLFEKGTKNIKVTYKYGFSDVPNDIYDAYLYLAAEMALGHVANRTGGGDISTQAWSRSWGPRGKYTHMRQDLRRQAQMKLKKYSTGVSGS